VTNYYNDFTAGTFEIGIGAWDTWAARYLAGVPLKVVSTVTDYDMLYIVAMQGGPKTVEDLRGKTLSATLSSGAYRVTKHALSAFHKMEADKDYKVQNTESPAGAVAMVLGGSAEGGLTWEPNVSVGLEREPKLTTIFNVGQDIQKGAGILLPYFAIALRDEAEKRHPGVSKLVSAAFNDCIRGVMENPEEAAKLSAAKMKVSEAALLSAFTSKRLVFRPAAMTDPVGREKLVKAAEYMTKNGMLDKAVPAGFIASYQRLYRLGLRLFRHYLLLCRRWNGHAVAGRRRYDMNVGIRVRRRLDDAVGAIEPLAEVLTLALGFLRL
jgi:NitT/TauT family transport system substrate-binding protein